MKTNHLKLTALALLPAALLTLSSCSSIPGHASSSVAKTSTSTTYVDTFKAIATVTAIDAATRRVKLTLADGKRVTVKCGPEVVNFSQIRIHDRVVVTLTAELAVYLDKGKAPSAAGAAAIAYAPVGGKPGKAVAEVVQATVRITAIDAKTRVVTYKTKSGAIHTIKAGEHIDFAKVKVGDTVTVRQTESVAVSVAKP
jgi:Cu/Ag efflux protein CusF